jgi:hypothetical protein
MRGVWALAGLGAALAGLTATQGFAAPFSFSTGPATDQIAVASRPAPAGSFEIETGDDFILNQEGRITGATFTGLLTGSSSLANINSVDVEIYRVFPNDSDVSRTGGPGSTPPFTTPNVPTRVNSPADNALTERSSGAGDLSFSGTELTPSFTALNSVQPGGIHPKPGQTTGGNGAVTGEEVEISVNFTTPFDLPPGHYFFVPQVGLDTGDNFLWLSGQRPTTPPFTPDLQSWTRDTALDPDWLRVGTDIVGAGTFNQAFSLEGTVPEPASLALLGSGLAALGVWRGRKRR